MFGLFVQRHAQLVSNHLRVSVLFFAPKNHSASVGWQIKKTDNLTEYIYYPRQFRFPVLGKIIKFFVFLFVMHIGFRNICKAQGRPDISHVHILTRMGVIAYLIRMRYKIPYVITEHWSRYLPIPGTYKGFFRKILTQKVCRNASAISTITNNLGQALIGHKLAKSFLIINNVVDTSLFVPENKSGSLVRIIHISCFENRSKNIIGLLEAFAELCSTKDNVELVLVGDGIDKSMIEQKTEEMKLSKRVRFTGVLEGKTLAHELASSSFLVISSNFENMPVVIPEAFACGIPVLATAVGGIPEWLDNQHGILVEPGSTKELAKGLLLMMEQFQSFDSIRIRQTAMQHFSPDGVWNQIAELYQKCYSDE